MCGLQWLLGPGQPHPGLVLLFNLTPGWDPVAKTSKTYYLVPFADKQDAKTLGGHWDPKAGQWYAASAAVAQRMSARWPPSPVLDMPGGLLPGEDRTFGGNMLFVDLVPQGCWFTNVRSCVDQASWSRLSRLTRHRAGYRCEICGAAAQPGKRVHLEAHERWHYDDATRVQSLRRIVTLCTPCHLVTHWGYARVSGREALAYTHYQKVAGIDLREVDRRVDEAFALWDERSRHAWTLDLSIITAAGLTVLTPEPAGIRGSTPG